jgi:hypothetical protein
MPAKDRYHNSVIQALNKAGWIITREQVYFRVGVRRLWIDIRAERGDGSSTILIEVKELENADSAVEALGEAIGKYQVYKAALHYLGITDMPLFLAVPKAAYDGILSEPLGQATLHQSGVSLMVFDPEREEIVEWIPEPKW